MKLTEDRPYANPEAAARKLIELANAVEAAQHGRIHIELHNGPMLFELKATPAEYRAGLKLAIESGWLKMHGSGTSCSSPRPAPSYLPDRSVSEAALPQLFFNISDQSGKPIFRECVNGLFRQAPRLRQPLFQFFTVTLVGHALSLFIYDGERARMFI
jgi:hypothetical protein